jgi:hypothetical protein
MRRTSCRSWNVSFGSTCSIGVCAFSVGKSAKCACLECFCWMALRMCIVLKRPGTCYLSVGRSRLRFLVAEIRFIDHSERPTTAAKLSSTISSSQTALPLPFAFERKTFYFHSFFFFFCSLSFSSSPSLTFFKLVCSKIFWIIFISSLTCCAARHSPSRPARLCSFTASSLSAVSLFSIVLFLANLLLHLCRSLPSSSSSSSQSFYPSSRFPLHQIVVVLVLIPLPFALCSHFLHLHSRSLCSVFVLSSRNLFEICFSFAFRPNLSLFSAALHHYFAFAFHLCSLTCSLHRTLHLHYLSLRFRLVSSPLLVFLSLSLSFSLSRSSCSLHSSLHLFSHLSPSSSSFPLHPCSFN